MHPSDVMPLLHAMTGLTSAISNIFPVRFSPSHWSGFPQFVYRWISSLLSFHEPFLFRLVALYQIIEKNNRNAITESSGRIAPIRIASQPITSPPHLPPTPPPKKKHQIRLWGGSPTFPNFNALNASAYISTFISEYATGSK
jgi:hypothetical protein